MGSQCCYRPPLQFEKDLSFVESDPSTSNTIKNKDLAYDVSYSVFQNDLKTLQDLHKQYSFEIDLNLDSDPPLRSPAHMAADLGQLQILE